MGKLPKIVGYGLCGPNEKYIEQTLNEFALLCDEVVILLNNAGQREKKLIESYGFFTVEDNREWGKYQWKIKEDFVKKYVRRRRPDICICLDMDEVFDRNFTKEKIYELYKQPFEAYYFFFVNLWDGGYNPARNFWNIRMWKWRSDLGLDFEQKNLHCGLYPKWAWYQAYYIPHYVVHYGLRDEEDRLKKVQRYKKYDPQARFIAKEYYDSLAGNAQILPFNEEDIYQQVRQFVKKTAQPYKHKTMPDPKKEFVFVRRDERVIDVPKHQVRFYTKQGWELVADAETVDEEMEELFSDPEPVVEQPEPVSHGTMVGTEIKKPAEEIDDSIESITIEKEPEFVVEEPKEKPEIESLKCDDCDYKATNPKQLHGHKIGKHKTWKKYLSRGG